VDLSSGGDLTSIAIVIPYHENGEKRYFVTTHSFIPSARVQEHVQSDRVPYGLWIQKGFATVTETLGGIKTDYKYILSYIKEQIDRYKLKPRYICYDPHNASAFLQDVEALGYDSLAITQTNKELNDATVDFRLEIMAGNVDIEGKEVGEGKLLPKDELLTWSILNAKVVTNSYGEIKIDKSEKEERIDPIDAIIDAWKMAMQEESTQDINQNIEEWLKLKEMYQM
jgi:phage terminase large subunit-like protein